MIIDNIYYDLEILNAKNPAIYKLNLHTTPRLGKMEILRVKSLFSSDFQQEELLCLISMSLNAIVVTS